MYSRSNPKNLIYFFLLTTAIISIGPAHSGDPVKEMADKIKEVGKKYDRRQDTVDMDKIETFPVAGSDPKFDSHRVRVEAREFSIMTVPKGTSAKDVKIKAFEHVFAENIDKTIANRAAKGSFILESSAPAELMAKMQVQIKDGELYIKGEHIQVDNNTAKVSLSSCKNPPVICVVVTNKKGPPDKLIVDQTGLH
jgi:hypothetical protein